jgi:hypothetical protein
MSQLTAASPGGSRSIANAENPLKINRETEGTVCEDEPKEIVAVHGARGRNLERAR